MMNGNREQEWRSKVTHPALVQLVAEAADPQTRQAPAAKLWHESTVGPDGSRIDWHASGLAVALAVGTPANAFGPGPGAQIEMQLDVDPRADGAGVESPPAPWMAYSVLCAGCGGIVKVRAERLLEGAVRALSGRHSGAGDSRVHI